MTDRERARELADKLANGVLFYGAVAGEHTVKMTGMTDEEKVMVVTAIRAYAAEQVTPDGLREKMAKAIDDISRVGWRLHYADDMEFRNAGECADAALRTIRDAGFVLVPREPTEAMIEAAEVSHIMIARGMAHDALRAAIAAAEKETGR